MEREPALNFLYRHGERLQSLIDNDAEDLLIQLEVAGGVRTATHLGREGMMTALNEQLAQHGLQVVNAPEAAVAWKRQLEEAAVAAEARQAACSMAGEHSTIPPGEMCDECDFLMPEPT